MLNLEMDELVEQIVKLIFLVEEHFSFIENEKLRKQLKLYFILTIPFLFINLINLS
jgi:hypothetical protein